VDTRVTLTPDRSEPAPLAAPRRKAPRDCPCCRRARFVHAGMSAYAGVLGALWLDAAGLPVWALVPAILAVGIAGGAVFWTSCALEGATAPKED
jgi:fatty acid desaturase